MRRHVERLVGGGDRPSSMPDKRAFASSERGDEAGGSGPRPGAARPPRRAPDSVRSPAARSAATPSTPRDEQRGRHDDRRAAAPTRARVTGAAATLRAGVASSIARRQPQDRVELGDREQQQLLHEVGDHRRRQRQPSARRIASAAHHHGHAADERDVEQRRRQATGGGDIKRRAGRWGTHHIRRSARIRRSHRRPTPSVPLG